MQVLLTVAARWLLRHLLSLLLIIAMLLLGKAAWVEWQAWRVIRAESALLNQASHETDVSLEALATKINARAAELQHATLATLEARISEVDTDISRKRLERMSFAGLGPILAGQSVAQAQLQVLQIDGSINLLQQERSWLQEAKLHLLARQSAQLQRRELERLRQHHVVLYSQWQEVAAELDQLERKPSIRRRIPGTTEYQKNKVLEQRLAQLLADNNRADLDYKRQLAVVNGAASPPPPSALSLSAQSAVSVLQPLRDRIQHLEGLERDNWISQFWRPVQEVLPTAAMILLGAILVPIVLKVVFYFVLAPLAARRPPVQLLPDCNGSLTLENAASSVSRSISLDPTNELLVHPEFLQSASVGAEKKTQWLLNWRYPLTSLSAGMAVLTCIRSDQPATFVVAATDALAEIGVIDLPFGSAVVMQPHNLVGVIQTRGAPLRITAHWRMTSLHAWLTLQLRYLALHGAARLIVQGCRGVRMEPASSGRSINQAATIAFSANLPYSTRRCETFVAYLFGKKELLNDCFGGAPGVGDSRVAGFFVYEEMPNADGRAGITGRGLQGLSDSALKVLGI